MKALHYLWWIARRSFEALRIHQAIAQIPSDGLHGNFDIQALYLSSDYPLSTIDYPLITSSSRHHRDFGLAR